MSERDDFLAGKVRDFERAPERERYDEQVEAGEELLTRFLDLYPFRTDPSAIEHLTADTIYSPGSEEYFLLWPEWRLPGLGGLFTWNDSAYVAAKLHPNIFKSILRDALTTDATIGNRVDAPWEQIKGFGFEKHIAKKIVSCYFADKCLPIFKTADLEHFASALDFLTEDDWERYWLECDTVGKKWEYLGSRVVSHLAPYRPRLGSHLAHLMYFMYHSFTPPGYKKVKLLRGTVSTEK